MEIITPEGSSDFEERLDKLERQFRLHNHADGITQPVFVGKVNQGASNLLIPPSGGVLGEGVNNGDALRMGMDYAPRVGQLLGLDKVNCNNDPNNFYYQTFKDIQSFPLKAITVWITNPSGSSGTLNVDLCSDNDGSLGSTLTYTGGFAFSPNITTPTPLTLFFPTPYTIAANTTYWLRFRCANVVIAELYYQSSNPYLDGKFMNDNFTEIGDIKMILYFGETIGQIYKCAALSEDETNAFIGIANKDGLTGENVDMIAAGFKTDYSGLTAGSVYYLTNSRGIIGTTAGLYTKKVAYAYNSTTLGINLF